MLEHPPSKVVVVSLGIGCLAKARVKARVKGYYFSTPLLKLATPLFCILFLAVSGETLEVEVNELTKGLQDIQKDIEEVSEEDIPGDMFRQIMTVSFQSVQ